MEQITDTLTPAIIYRQELDAVIIRLADAQRNNTILIIAIITLSLIFIVLSFYFIRRSHNKIKNEKLANKLLKQSATVLPSFTEKVNKLSSKSLKLSETLYDEFQEAIDSIKNQQKNNISIIVNDNEFKSQYPYIQEITNLSAQEKIVLILYEEDFKTNEIALFLCISDNAVRAIKTRIKNKLMQSGSNSNNNYKKLKILKSKS